VLGSASQTGVKSILKNSTVVFCGNCDALLQRGNRGPVPRAGRTGLSPAV